MVETAHRRRPGHFLAVILRPSLDAVVAALVSIDGAAPVTASLSLDGDFADRLERFVRDRVPDEPVAICIELYREPQATFPKLPLFLQGVGRFGLFGLVVAEDRRHFAADDVPENVGGAIGSQNRAQLMFPGIARAFTSFVRQDAATEENVAITLAQIAASPGRYRYFRSLGVVQSGGDVAVFLAHPPASGSGVIGGEDFYHLVATPATTVGTARGDVFLSYELGKRTFPDLLERNALKMGLLRVCREFGIELYCLPLAGPDSEHLEALLRSNRVALPASTRVWP